MELSKYRSRDAGKSARSEFYYGDGKYATSRNYDGNVIGNKKNFLSPLLSACFQSIEFLQILFAMKMKSILQNSTNTRLFDRWSGIFVGKLTRAERMKKNVGSPVWLLVFYLVWNMIRR